MRTTAPAPAPAPTRPARRTALTLAALALTGAGAGGVAAGPAEAATAASAGYALVTGTELGPRQPVQGFSTTGATPVVTALASGRSLVFFPGLRDPGHVAHVRSVDGGTCQLDDGVLISEPGAQVLVACFDLAGQPARHAFQVSVRAEGVERGHLVTAVSRRVTTPGLTVPKVQSSTIGGSVTLQRLAPGRYRFSLPRLPGAGSGGLAVTPLDTAMAVCGITGTAVAAGGSVQFVDVSCRGPLTTGPRDAGLSLSWAKATNVLGVSDLSRVYASVARSTAATRTLPAAAATNEFASLRGTTRVLRKGPGRYVVQLQHQQAGGLGGHTTAVTARGGTASCLVLDSTPSSATAGQDVAVTCENALGQLVDTAFELTYATQQ